MDMFSPESYCLLKPGELRDHFAGWESVSCVRQEFPTPRDTLKVFATAIARKAVQTDGA